MAKITGDQWTKLRSLLQLRGFVTEKSADHRGRIYKFGPAGTLLKNNIRRTWQADLLLPQDNLFISKHVIIKNQLIFNVSTIEF